MKKILYLMHIPWGWIKQRPHFIAEHLADYFDVHIYSTKQYMNKNRTEVKHPLLKPLKIKEWFQFPLPDQSFFRKINSSLVEFQSGLMTHQYEFIWLTHPALFGMVKKVIPKRSTVIYDCMDNALEFPQTKSDPDLRKATLNNEQELVDRSDIIFTSSDYLKKILGERYPLKKEIVVVNNAFSSELRRDPHLHLNNKLLMQMDTAFNLKGKKVAYIGTISEWIDFDLILKSLETFKDLNYMFWGPSETKLPKHERLSFYSPIEHRYVSSLMERSDALIMPFKINELVRSINPVKLYEYIYSSKPSIALEYEETLKFTNFVYLYRNKEEYFNLMESLTKGRLSLKKVPEEYKDFAENNTWSHRTQVILNKMLEY